MRSQKPATLRIACSTKTSSFRTSMIPTIWPLMSFGLAFLVRPLEQRPHDAAKLPREAATGRVAFTRIVHVERDRLAGAGVWLQLARAERGDRELHREEAFVEDVLRDPGRRHVVTWLHGIVPARIGVERVEDDVSLGCIELELRKDRVPRLANGETDLYADPFAHVRGVDRVTVLHNTPPTQGGDAVGPGRIGVGPLSERAGALA